MTHQITALDCFDVRFPTSLALHGSDAMNPDPDYSAAYAVLRTDADGLEGHAVCFTIGRGNDIVVAAVTTRETTGKDVDLETLTAAIRSWNQRKERLFTKHHVRVATECLKELGWV